MKKENTTEKPKKIKRKGRILLFTFNLSFFVLLVFLAFYSFIMPDRSFSENENRVLEQSPSITAQGLFDGSFMKKYEAYLTDQFPFRDGAISLKSHLERLLGKKEENGAYIGKNGFIFDFQADYDEEKMKELAKAVNSFKKKNPSLNTVFALVPNSSFVYAENLPEYLECDNQQLQTEQFYSFLDKEILTVNAAEALLEGKKENQMFYKTDHHWTTRGAFCVFEKLKMPLKMEADETEYEFYNVSNRFRGTLGSKVASVNSLDSVEICLPKDSAGSYFIDFYNQREKSATFFFEEKLKEKNKYEVFLGGNYEKLSVSTTLEGDRKLLVIKDSYANCLLPMLTPYFSKILVLDPRYMTESVDTVMMEDSFTDVLFLYNANTLFQDTTLKTVLES